MGGLRPAMLRWRPATLFAIGPHMHPRLAIHFGVLAAHQAVALCYGAQASYAADAGPPFRDCVTRHATYNMQSSSMAPLLPKGSMALFECFDHAIRDSAIPLDSITINTLHPGLQAGDVVVFRPSHNPEEAWTKRVVGLPGDTVELADGKLVINGVAVRTEPGGTYQAEDEHAAPMALVRETLANGRSYVVLPNEPRGWAATMGTVTVPPGNLFVLGDNRSHSMDSRFQEKFGFVPIVNLIARAMVAEAAGPAPATASIQDARLSGPAAP